MLIVLAFIYMYKLQYDTVSCTCDHVLVLKLHNYTSAFRVFLRKRVKTGFKKKKKEVFIAIHPHYWSKAPVAFNGN